MKNYVTLNKYSGNSTKINYKNNVPFISFRALDKFDWLKNGFSTRLGGISEEHLSSMNLGFTRGDRHENVIKNHEIIVDALGLKAEDIVTSHQTHTTNIRTVTGADKGKGIYMPRDYENIDGLITNERGIVLATYFADCVPLYIVDTKNQAIGLSHSGWKGTVNKIGQKTIALMKETYNTNPTDVIACIGPSICMKCYEVSSDVAKQFMKAFPDNIEDILITKPDDKYLLDLWECNKIIFKQAGVPTSNIFTTDICTCCNMDILFSHRGHNGMRGNMAAFLSLV